ncbi:MAG: hypothetical protein JWR15_3889 [Prosthecobacter sp.]|nr:hypothetical protein [Prosthecobacter sp.]
MNADTLLHWLLRTSLEASLLILAVLGLRLMLGTRLSPAWRIGLWMLVGVKLMLPAFIPAGFGLGAWFQRDEAVSISDVSVSQFVGTADPVSSLDAGSSQMVSDAIGGIGSVAEAAVMFSGYTVALCLWLTGALFVFAAALYRQRSFNLALRQRPLGTAPLLRALVASLSQKAGIRRSVRILLMPAGTTPAVVGIEQPSILIPEDWETRFDESSLRHVLLHELLHVKQHDLIWNWAAIAVQALHWFNPLVWFVVSRFQADRELRCDAGALALLSPTERLDYGHTLLRIQETFFAPPAMAGLAPCVRNHPTLRQRIHMIAHPTTRQPVLQLLLVLTLGTLVCYSFTTARAAEKEVPAKERSREGVRTPAPEMTKPSPGPHTNRIVAVVDGVPIASSELRKAMEADGGKHTEEEVLESMIQERIAFFQKKHPGKQIQVTRSGAAGQKIGSEEDGTPARIREGDGGSKKPGMRDRDGGTKKPGTGDGDGARKPGMRDGDGGTKKPATGDGEGGAKKTGVRDGEKPRTGERDGEGSKKTAARDGEGGQKTGERDGEGGKTATSEETINLRIVNKGEAVMIGEEVIAMNRLRGHLSSLLPDHPGAKILISAEADTPHKAVLNTLDAVRDNGSKNAEIKAE